MGPKPGAGDLLYRPGFPACTGYAMNRNSTDPLLNVSRGGGEADSTGDGVQELCNRSIL